MGGSAPDQNRRALLQPAAAEAGGRAEGSTIASAIERMLAALSLRRDSGRVALEGILTGLALGLSLHTLQADAAAAAPGAPALEGPATGSSATAAPEAEGEADAAEATGARPAGQGRTPSPPRQPLRPLEEAGPAAAEPEAGAGAGARAAGGGGEAVAPLLTETASAQRIGGAATPSGAPAAGGLPPEALSSDGWPSGAQAAQPAAAARPAAASKADSGGEGEGIRARPIPTAAGGTAPMPLPTPRLGIGVSSRISVVSRSVEARAEAVIRQEQIAVADSRLDLRQSPIREVEISAERDLRGFADSHGDGALLRQEGSLLALSGSTLLGSEEDSRTRITAIDQLHLGVRSPEGAELAVENRVIALEASTLEDAAGQDSLTIEACLALLLAGSAATMAPAPLELHSTAVQDSTLRLGAGDDQVRIGAALLLSSEMPVAGLAVNGGATGLRTSLLETGSGDDRVEIGALAVATALDPLGAGRNGNGAQAGAGLTAVALEESRLSLGPGDDRLLLQGDVRRSTLEPGPGDDRLVLAGGSLSDSVLLLDPEGRVALELGDGDDSLRIEGRGSVALQAAGGDDRIVIGPGARGVVDGGAGEDLLELEASDWAADWAWGSAPAELPAHAPEERPADGRAIALPGASDPVLAGAAPEPSVTEGAMAVPPVAVTPMAFPPVAVPSVATELLRTPASAAGVVATAPLEQPTGSGEEGSIRLQGGPGQDLFVLPDLAGLLGRPRPPQPVQAVSVSSRTPAPAAAAPTAEAAAAEAGTALAPIAVPASAPGRRATLGATLSPLRRTTLVDLTWRDAPGGGPELSDRLALRRSPAATTPAGGARSEAGAALILLSPSGLEGLGDARLLPIAPLEQLLAGMADVAPQLAIATGAGGSELVLLASVMEALPLAALPGLRSRSPLAGGEVSVLALQPVRSAGQL